MEVKSQQERIKAYRREICERAENIVDIHKNLWADDIAVSRTITGESYLPLSRHAANWPSPFLRARKPSPFSSPDVLLLRFTLHLETLRFHLIGMSFVGSCLRNTNCDPDGVRLKIWWNLLGNVFVEDQVDFAKGFKIRLSDVCHCFAVQDNGNENTKLQFDGLQNLPKLLLEQTFHQRPSHSLTEKLEKRMGPESSSDV